MNEIEKGGPFPIVPLMLSGVVLLALFAGVKSPGLLENIPWYAYAIIIFFIFFGLFRGGK